MMETCINLCQKEIRRRLDAEERLAKAENRISKLEKERDEYRKLTLGCKDALVQLLNQRKVREDDSGVALSPHTLSTPKEEPCESDSADRPHCMMDMDKLVADIVLKMEPEDVDSPHDTDALSEVTSQALMLSAAESAKLRKRSSTTPTRQDTKSTPAKSIAGKARRKTVAVNGRRLKNVKVNNISDTSVDCAPSSSFEGSQAVVTAQPRKRVQKLAQPDSKRFVLLNGYEMTKGTIFIEGDCARMWWNCRWHANGCPGSAFSEIDSVELVLRNEHNHAWDELPTRSY
ncbi:hypothetical protein AAVH_05215 [Aphelenchoides avenae]|nr:hypothetical protein AAVH_05215 [Aphelenchus avenae]